MLLCSLSLLFWWMLASLLQTTSTLRKVCQGDIESCSKSCYCYIDDKNAVEVKCADSNLTNVPLIFPGEAAIVDLSGNKITEIRQYAFIGCKYLKTLYLNSINAQRIHKNAFTDLINLKELQLGNNRLSLDFLSLPKGIFTNLSNLMTLDISGNVWENVTAYRDDLVAELAKLETLVLDGLPGLTPFNRGFSKLSSLKTLTIIGGLDVISKRHFCVFENVSLHSLQIVGTNLYYIEEDAFANIPKLKSLALKENPKLGLLNVSKSFKGLKNTSITALTVQGCTQLFGPPHDLTQEFFEPLKDLRLVKLVLKSNNIGVICPCFSSYLPMLETLVIDNFYWYGLVHLTIDIPKLQHLTYLVIRSDAHPVYDYFIYPTLEENDHGNTYKLEKNANGHNHKEKLHCHHTLTFQMPPMLKHLKVRLASLYRLCSTMPTIRILGISAISMLSLSVTDLETAEIIFEKPQKPLHLDLSHNSIRHLNEDFLTQSIQNGLDLISLNLGFNYLRGQIKENLLYQLKNLETLNIANSDLFSLPTEVFKYSGNLKHLILYENGFQHISFNLHYLTNLEEIDLSHNALTYLDQHTTEALDRMARNRTISVNLRENPFICSCDSLNFMKWMMRTSVILKLKEIYICSFGQEKVPLPLWGKGLLHNLERACSSKTYIMAASVAFGIFIIVLAAIVFLYRHRWDVKFCCLNLVRQRKIHQETEDQRMYHYDAFVAYDVEDVLWVKNELIPHLEGDKDVETLTTSNAHFTLCVHHRDFIPGTPIEENIIDSINNSNKTILVLSKNFVESNWCDFELQMARTKCFDEGRDIIIIIMLEPVPAASMSATLSALIRRVTYLEWPHLVHGREAFWTKLRESLQQRNTRNLVCPCGRVFHKQD